MEVTKHNFSEAAPVFLSALEKCTLIGMDIECSGITSENPVQRTDTPMEYYYKILPVAVRFKIIQLGFSLFVPEGDSFEVHTFYFYLFPSTAGDKIAQNFGMEVSSIEFLKNCGTIDFNKWIKDGLASFPEHHRATLRNFIFEKKTVNLFEKLELKEEGAEPVKIHNDEERARMDSRIKDFEEWIKAPEEPFVIEEPRPFLLRYFIEQNNEMIKNKSRLILKDEKVGQMIRYTFTFVTEDSKKEAETQRKEKLEETYEAELGFSSLWEKMKVIWQEKKIPVVGHNSIVDLIFVTSQLEKQLPVNYFDAKSLISSVFPVFYDTKILASEIDLGNLSLSELHEKLFRNPESPIKTKFTFKYSENEVAYHNAGLDAQATGQVFLGLKEKVPHFEKFTNLVKIYTNKIFHINLAEKTKDHIISPDLLVLYPIVPQGAVKDDELIKLKNIAFDSVRNHNKLLEANNRVSEHRALFLLSNNKVYILELDKNDKAKDLLMKELEKKFDIVPLQTHYERVAKEFEEKVYGQTNSKYPFLTRL